MSSSVHLSPITMGTPDLIAAAEAFASSVGDVDRQSRKAGLTIPLPEARARVRRAFTSLVDVMDQVALDAPSAETIARFRTIVGRWLFRSPLWSRAYLKPHGHAGDFKTIEWMYDLETSRCADPTQPAIVNCLDEVLKSVPSVVSIWERRRWFAGLLHDQSDRKPQGLRVLDVAAGGARYLRDFLVTAPDRNVHLTVVDQDPAAISYCRTYALAAFAHKVDLICAPLRDLPRLIEDQSYDVVIAAGLFDYFDQPTGTAMLAALAPHVAAGGTIALSNFHVDDRSRRVKDWLVDWRLIYRDESLCAAMFPPGLDVTTHRSDNGALIYARAIRP